MKMTGQHPSEAILALYSSSDLDWRDRIRTGLHVRRCERCHEKMEGFRADRTARREGASSMPLPPNWDSLAEEMAANIRLGLSASECIRQPAPRPAVNIGGAIRPGWYWKPAAGILASMALVVVALVSLQGDVFLRVWNVAVHGVNEPPPIVLESSSNGVEFRRGSRTKMRLLVGNYKPEQVSVSLDGSVRAQYVDDDSLQVTVTNVYAQ